jgi:hypothetical protein
MVPFRGDTATAVFDSILHRAPLTPLRLNPDLPPELERIINRALEKDRKLRYQSAAEIRSELQRLKRDTDLARSATVATAAGFDEEAAQALGPEISSSSPTMSVSRAAARRSTPQEPQTQEAAPAAAAARPKRRWLLITLEALAVVAVAVALVPYFLRHPKPAPTPAPAPAAAATNAAATGTNTAGTSGAKAGATSAAATPAAAAPAPSKPAVSKAEEARKRAVERAAELRRERAAERAKKAEAAAEAAAKEPAKTAAPTTTSAAKTATTAAAAATTAAPSAAKAAAPVKIRVPVADAMVGKCTASFMISDAAGKPASDAQLTVQIRHGFLALQKTDVQVVTNSNGEARFSGLPDDPSLKFHVEYEKSAKTVVDNSRQSCDNHFDVQMGK